MLCPRWPCPVGRVLPSSEPANGRSRLRGDRWLAEMNGRTAFVGEAGEAPATQKKPGWTEVFRKMNTGLSDKYCRAQEFLKNMLDKFTVVLSVVEGTGYYRARIDGLSQQLR